MLRLLKAFVYRDARLFAVDRQAVVMSFVVPVLIASILGWLDSSAASTKPGEKIDFLYVDQDHSAVSKALLDRLSKTDVVTPKSASLVDAQRGIRDGTATAAAVIPYGFGALAAGAMMGGKKPEVLLLTDPSKRIEGQVVHGAIVAEASAAVAKSVYGDIAGNATAPLTVREESGAGKAGTWGKAAHDYSGFGLQGLLFFAIESAISLSRERRLGIWRRLRAAPVPPYIFVLSKGVSSTILAFGIFLAMFAFGALLFGIRVLGSGLGFFLIAGAAAAVAGTFGLLMATIGKTETQARGLSILVILVMLATGGAWFPMEQMPSWVQKGADFLPVRWAVEGFDAMTWRGLGLAEASHYAGILALFAVVFAVLAVLRFRSPKFA